MPKHTRHRVQAALDQLAAAVEAEDHPDDIALWAVAALASRFGVSFALSNESAPLPALEEVGQEWAEQIIEMLDDYPDRQSDTLRVAWAVVRRLVEDVRRRGLTDGPTRRRLDEGGR
jgi:hypothetical protein